METLRGAGIIGIRREDKNAWERRVVVTPSQVRQLISAGLRVLVEPSDIRCFPDKEYERVGAELTDDLSPANFIIGVKEVPIEKLLPNRSYVFFSHTIKAQPYNMPLLDAVISKNIRLFDFEPIRDSTGTRIVRFGPFAGLAGAIDALHVLGHRLLDHGFATPLLYISWARNYMNLKQAKDEISRIGDYIRENDLLPEEMRPFVFTITSSGSVSRGAQEVLEALGVKRVSAQELPHLPTDSSEMYLTVVGRKDYLVRHGGGPFSADEYENSPEMYYSCAVETILPYTHVLINCTYWEPRFPRIASVEEMVDLHAAGRLPLIVLADISCDPNGSIGIFERSTPIDRPIYAYDLSTQTTSPDGLSVTGYPGVVILGVDHLPAELPFDASKSFGEAFLPYIEAIARSDASLPWEEQIASLPQEIADACICVGGKLTPNFEYITDLRREFAEARGRVVIFGSGFVAKPVVDLIWDHPRQPEIIIATNIPEQGHALAESRSRISVVDVDVSNDEQLDSFILGANVVVSIVPAFLHMHIAKSCLRCGVHLLTASYTSEAMRALSSEVEEAGLLFLNEMGLDPGIDHMSAKCLIDKFVDQGYRLKSFTSFCGGLPSPDCADNPFGYKFSWNPRGVFSAAMSAARYRKDAHVVEVAAGQAYSRENCKQYFFSPGFETYCVPNRDSTIYASIYGIEEAETLLRGTLRYRGFAEMLRGLLSLGLLGDESIESPSFSTWPAAVASAIGLLDVNESLVQHVEKVLSERDFPVDEIRHVLYGLRWLGMLDASTPFTWKGSMIDTVCAHLETRLSYKNGERDAVLMKHSFEFVRGEEVVRASSRLIAFGDPNGYSAMSWTVGAPLAIAARMLLSDELRVRGVCTPVLREIYEPVLHELSKLGISLVEEVE